MDWNPERPFHVKLKADMNWYGAHRGLIISFYEKLYDYYCPAYKNQLLAVNKKYHRNVGVQEATEIFQMRGGGKNKQAGAANAQFKQSDTKGKNAAGKTEENKTQTPGKKKRKRSRSKSKKKTEGTKPAVMGLKSTGGGWAPAKMQNPQN